MLFFQEFNDKWNFSTKLFFRFIFSYFIFYFSLMFIGPFLDTPIRWFAEHILHWGSRFINKSSGSGDRTYNYVLIAFNFFLTLLILPAWSYLDRKRNSYSGLLKWFYLFIRSVLCITMLLYGTAKIVKGQFPDPSLLKLLQPLGEMSPMGLAWTFLGYSFIYNIFIGFAELLGGLLMMYRKTVTLGSIVIIGVMSNVVIMNFVYDIPVKLFSLHLLLMGFILLLKDLKRLIQFFLKNEPTESVNHYIYFNNPTFNNIGSVIRIFIVFIVLGTTIGQIFIQFNIHDQLKEKSEFYGIWQTERFIRNRVIQPPLTNDYNRWEYLIIDHKKTGIVKKMDGSNRHYAFELIPSNQEIIFSNAIGSEAYPLKYSFTDSKFLELNGVLNGDTLSIRLQRIPLSKFPLINRGFHWINEFPYNR